MGLLASKFVDAWRGAQPRGADDLRPTQTRLCKGCGRWVIASLIGLTAPPAIAETIRIATFAAPISRDGPGLLLRDLRKAEDPQIAATQAIIAHVAPDILVLTDFDYDLDGLALEAFNARSLNYPYQYASLPNTGMQTGIDLDGDGYLGDARDGQGYGRFSGDGGMAILSRFPIEAVRDLSATLWKDVQGATLPTKDGNPFPSAQAREIQRLSTTAHWIVPMTLPGGSRLTLLALSATPPVFDGDEDRNGLQNRDELLLFENIIAAEVPARFVVIGNANLDPSDGQGFTSAMTHFLANPAIQDPEPASMGGQIAANPTHRGNPANDTADWDDDVPRNLRVSYVLPSMDWQVKDSGVFWPAPDDPDAALLGDDGLAAGPHRLVWVDLALE